MYTLWLCVMGPCVKGGGVVYTVGGYAWDLTIEVSLCSLGTYVISGHVHISTILLGELCEYVCSSEIINSLCTLICLNKPTEIFFFTDRRT